MERAIVVLLAAAGFAGCPEPADQPPAPPPVTENAPPPPSEVTVDLDALDAWMDGAQLVEIAGRAAREGTPDERRRAVRRIGEMSEEMDGDAYRQRLRHQASETIRTSGRPPTDALIEETVRLNHRLRYAALVQALAAFVPAEAEAIGRLVRIAEQRRDEETRLAALAALAGHAGPGNIDRLLVIAEDTGSPETVRGAALERVAEIGEAGSVARLWPLVEGDGPALVRQKAAEAALSSGGREAATELFQRLPPEREYPPPVVDALVDRLMRIEPTVSELVLQQLTARSWPCRVIALRYFHNDSLSPAAQERIGPLRSDRERLVPADAWAADGDLRTVGDLARRILELHAAPY